MHQRLRLRAAGAALAATCALSVSATDAQAYVTSDIANITLGTSFAPLAGGSTFSISADPAQHAQFRWLQAAGKATIISANNCNNLNEYGRINYPAGDTTYGTLFSGGTGTCFVVRGRTQTGEGAMANSHDGRLRR
jgi:hypothetical protein